MTKYSKRSLIRSCHKRLGLPHVEIPQSYTTMVSIVTIANAPLLASAFNRLRAFCHFGTATCMRIAQGFIASIFYAVQEHLQPSESSNELLYIMISFQILNVV